MSESNGDRPRRSSCAEWILEIQMKLGSVMNNEAKTCSICRVPEKLPEAEAEDKGYSYRPQLVAMGPFHSSTRSDLPIMEETKWRSVYKLLSRPTPNMLLLATIKNCCEAIKEIESIIRASYGEKIEMAAEEFSRMMLLDGCFFSELLLGLTENENDPSLDYMNDEKKMLRVLTDLTLLENQIPFVVLTTLFSLIFPPHDRQRDPATPIPPQNLAESLFECNVDSSQSVYHFLHLMHLCSPDPYEKEGRSKDPLQLQRCARKLQAFGITIKASQPNDSEGNNRNGTAASVLREFADKFEFKIEFKEKDRELIIPTLRIKEATEVKWRNLIAWEQIGLTGIGYKFTSYAHFFKGLASSVHDIKLLKDRRVIIVHKEARDEDLVIMFQSITTGAEKMDGRYRAVCEGLNKAKVNGVAGCCALVFRMPWHYWRRFLEFPRRRLISWILSFIKTCLGTPWKVIGVVSGAAVLVLSYM